MKFECQASNCGSICAGCAGGWTSHRMRKDMMSTAWRRPNMLITYIYCSHNMGELIILKLVHVCMCGWKDGHNDSEQPRANCCHSVVALDKCQLGGNRTVTSRQVCTSTYNNSTSVPEYDCIFCKSPSDITFHNFYAFVGYFYARTRSERVTSDRAFEAVSQRKE